MKRDPERIPNKTAFFRGDNGGAVFLADGDGDRTFLTADRAVAEFKRKAITALADLELPPETMRAVLRAIEDLH